MELGTTDGIRISGSILELRNFGVAFGEQKVLVDATLTVPERGVTVLLGPAGTGKSVLLRALAGFNDAQPAYRSWGTALYAGETLGRRDRPALLSQNARLLIDSILENIASALPERHTLTPTQQRELIRRLLSRCGLDEVCDRLSDEVVQLPLGLQRRVAIARTVAPNPYLLLLDEPTAGLGEVESSQLLQLVKDEAERRAVLMVTHNQEHAQAIASSVVLLVAGEVREQTEAAQFFREPQTDLARQFIRTGSCSLAPIEYDEAEESPVEEPTPTPSKPPEPLPSSPSVPAGYGPRGFRWLKPGLLAGTPRPGIIADVEYDLETLRRVGIRVLVTLEEEPFDPLMLKRYDIEPIHLPIPDMGAPSVPETVDICRRIDSLTRAGTPVAVHCRAGLGRTGTLLACQLIWDGKPPLESLERVRQIEPRWVQSDAQVQHLKAFSSGLARGK